MPAAPVDESRRPNLILRLLRDQRIQYLIVGGLNTLVGFGLFVSADLTVGRYLDEAANTVVGSLVTLVVAHILGVLFAFTLYRRFVFRVTGHVLRDLARFESVYLVALGVNAVALPLLVQLGLNRILAQALITITTTVISYLGHRFFSFRRSPETAILEDPARLAEEQNVTGEETTA